MNNIKHFFTKPKIVFMVFSAFVYIAYFLLELLDLNFINSTITLVFSLIRISIIAAWICMFILYKIKKLWMKIILAIVTIAFFASFIPYLLLFQTLDGTVCYESSSPSGKNTVVVFDGGFIDAQYRAYPKHGIFYKHQDNGFVSRHDFWGGADIQVTWENEDKAVVKVLMGDFPVIENANKDDIIIVSFE